MKGEMSTPQWLDVWMMMHAMPGVCIVRIFNRLLVSSMCGQLDHLLHRLGVGAVPDYGSNLSQKPPATVGSSAAACYLLCALGREQLCRVFTVMVSHLSRRIRVPCTLVLPEKLRYANACLRD